MKKSISLAQSIWHCAIVCYAPYLQSISSLILLDFEEERLCVSQLNQNNKECKFNLNTKHRKNSVLSTRQQTINANIPIYLLYKFFCFNIIINYMQEGNSYTNSDSAKMSIETTFQLKRSGVSSTCVSVEVDFSPALQQKSGNDSSATQKVVSRSIPIFNIDKNYFTPSFILQMDKNKYIQNQHIYQTLFEKKIEQMDQQKTQMYLPKPSKTNSFCCICKAVFEDYLTHVNLPMHKALMQKSEFHGYIQQICAKYCPSVVEPAAKKSRGKEPKTKAIKKELRTRKCRKAEQTPSLTAIPSCTDLPENVQLM